MSYLLWGTVLDGGEDPRSERVRAAGGPGLALAYHGAYEFNSPLSALPGGTEWQAVVERTTPDERHFAVHEQHCVGLNDADRAAWDAGGYALLEQATVSGTADHVAARLNELEAAGRDRIGVSTVRSGHPARARGVHGHRAGDRRGVKARSWP